MSWLPLIALFAAGIALGVAGTILYFIFVWMRIDR